MKVNITGDNEELHDLEAVGVSIYPVEKKAEVHFSGQLIWVFKYKSFKYDDGTEPLEIPGAEAEPDDIMEDREPSWNFCVAENEKIQRTLMLDQVMASMTQGLAQAQAQAQMNGLHIIDPNKKQRH